MLGNGLDPLCSGPGGCCDLDIGRITLQEEEKNAAAPGDRRRLSRGHFDSTWKGKGRFLRWAVAVQRRRDALESEEAKEQRARSKEVEGEDMGAASPESGAEAGISG
ncbi:hypothetical protein KM043_017988 [Ampulex compressa]|nr:hypothetical protein KM043_017988 [Ampulex compressa]